MRWQSQMCSRQPEEPAVSVAFASHQPCSILFHLFHPWNSGTKWNNTLFSRLGPMECKMGDLQPTHKKVPIALWRQAL